MKSVSVLKVWNYWSTVPLIGKWIVSWLISFVSPYTGSIPFRIEKLTTAECLSSMTDSWWTRNPFKSVHAAALTNFGECTMGMVVLGWSDQNKCRAIPTRLEVDFLKKVLSIENRPRESSRVFANCPIHCSNLPRRARKQQ